MFTFPQGFYKGIPEVGSGLRFDGVNDYVSIPFSSILDLGLTKPQSFNIIFKIKSYASPINLLIDNRTLNLLQRGFNLTLRGDKSIDVSKVATTAPTMRLSSVKSFVSYELNQIYQLCVTLAATKDASGIKIYTDDIDTSGSVLFNTLLDGDDVSGTNYNIASYQGTSFFSNVEIYDLKIFNKELSPSEVSQLHNSFSKNLTGLTTNIIANYDFEQSSGSTLIDSSGNALNGTLINVANTNLGSNNAWVDQYGNPILT